MPLSDCAAALLEAIGPNAAGPIFAERGRGLSDAAMLRLMRRLAPGATVRGLRSTFRDWAGDMSDAPREVAEAALAHAVSDAAERAYRRGDALASRSRSRR